MAHQSNESLMLERFTYLVCASGLRGETTLLYHTQKYMKPEEEARIKELLREEVGELLDVSIDQLDGFEKEELTKISVPKMRFWTTQDLLQQKTA